jgi:histone acetyltransferase MYST1
MDEWVSEDACMEEQLEPTQLRQGGRKRKRGRQAESPSPGTSSSTGGRDGSTKPLENGVNEEPKEIVMTEEDYDIQHHKQITAQRNFDFVNFGEYQIKTWSVLYSLELSCDIS